MESLFQKKNEGVAFSWYFSSLIKAYKNGEYVLLENIEKAN